MPSIDSDNLESTATISPPDELDSLSVAFEGFDEVGLSMPTEGELPVVVVVDDEVQILKAVRRLLTPLDCEVRTVVSGGDAIDILEEEEVAVLISDQRMPGMSGLALFNHARQHHPKTVRIMLTGTGDMQTAMEAINEGRVFRYVAKPWDHDRFVRTIDEAIEQFELKCANERFEQHIREQNEQLRELNRELERRVEERTNEVTARNEKIQKLNDELEESFSSTIKALLSIMELGDNHIVGHCRKTAERLKRFSKHLDLGGVERRHLERAALLHWIGLINAPSSMFKKRVDDYDAEELATWEFHPTLGQQAVAHVPALHEATQIILHYLRRYDDPSFEPGQNGYSESQVRGCYMLHICSTFERICRIEREIGGVERGAAAERALARLEDGAGAEFEPQLVRAFIRMIAQESASREIEQKVSLDELEEGMVLSRPVETAQGVPVAPRDVVVTPELITRLERFRSSKGLGAIFVRK